ncbi:helix-turn-helix transcriptional regulator [Actinoplanes sp. NBRC 103695]|uniref:helix-turn-helix domain-containing protein n=1 Tax=Actinoplanes sp. NBRC 103695 TaxID=3032202 RepID=UPI0024A29B91|nr:helix-turn-helix transcriptional regulator [Actinoplanes sp. NBRC 103695]GLZ00322.1 transcriptional regulator [Actinoplanes sp. NBRC 103695]
MADNRLGEFLRARRELTRPEQVGLPAGTTRRRVSGLRREEVAMLSGVSADYYVRLEQGRDKHPSDQVLEALSRVLDLGADGLEHARRLAGPARPGRRRSARTPRVDPALRRLLDALAGCPAMVTSRYLDVLASNVLAAALHPIFGEGSNLVRALFLDPGAHDCYPDWDRVAQETVASLRAAAGADPDHPRLAELVGELSVKSPEFLALWARHEVKAKTRGRKQIVNAEVGLLTVEYETLTVPGADGQLLVVYHAEPHSPSAEGLALLGSVAASV